MASSNGDRIREFMEIKRVPKGSYDLFTYKICLQKEIVGHFFSARLVLVGLEWTFQFSFDQPFFLNELLFPRLTVSDIKLVSPYLPKKKHTMDHFYYTFKESDRRPEC